jgi:hypothetical protein
MLHAIVILTPRPTHTSQLDWVMLMLMMHHYTAAAYAFARSSTLSSR